MTFDDAKLRDRPEVTTRDDNPLPPEDNALTRRTAMKLFSVTALMGAVAGCTRKPERYIYSVVDRPEYQRPGTPLYYHSTWTDGLYPYGITVKCVDGRPIKIEGHEEHPLNLGKACAPMQAALVSLYDPERLKSPRSGKNDVTWEQADKRIVKALQAASSTVVVTRGLLGPSEQALAAQFLKAAPGAKHFVHEPAVDRERRAAWKAIYGADGELVPEFDKADVIVSIDCDFLGTDGDVVSNTRRFAATRRPEAGTFSRLYVAEGGMTVTGSSADHRLPMRPSEASALVAALAGGTAKEGWDAKVIAAMREDLAANRGKALVVAGPHLPAAVHAAVAKLNAELQAPLLWNAAPALLPANDPQEIRAALAAGADVAIFLGVNPVYDLPGADLAKVKLSIAHGLTANETLAACDIALPSAHNLESWNDTAPLAGMTTYCQPMIAPLFGGRQEADSLLAWTKALDESATDAEDFHDYVKARSGLEAKAWQAALRKGYTGSGSFAQAPAPKSLDSTAPAAGAAGTMDVVLVADPFLGDGRWAGNPWLLETPEPVTQLVWDNAAMMGPAAAKALGVAKEDWVTITLGDATLDLPVLVKTGFQKDTILVHLGWGRTAGAGVGDRVGINAYPLSAAGHLLVGAKVKSAGKQKYHLVRTQRAHDQMDREIARSATAKEFAAHSDFAKHRRHHPPLDQIDQEVDYTKGHKWVLGIDLNQCTGCNACMVACQSENNIPTVGKDEVSLGRDMSWIRIDRYEKGDPENPEISQMPMLCQHCDNAPCETVCPVNATVHSPEGLNDQIYNRCVGTRYCANNCPYKVRRFNFFNYTKQAIDTPVEELAQNPHVTVRMRGVMEKCTFCVQRINAAKFERSNKGEKVEDGDVVTACQQACPADAIVFGDENIEGSKIAAARKADLAYHVLEELNVRPNVTYQARVRNLHPSLDDYTPGAAKKGGH